ncbi:MAG: GAF domain-containing protein [Anaerolineales bacterium]|nr:GAF domain-containing protein [Anaerolineales bacterium]
MGKNAIQILSWVIAVFILLAQSSCTATKTPQTAHQPAPTADTFSVPRQVAPESLPEICNCILRFDAIGIEQGLSQSSVRVAFQDSRGFLWFGTEDGLNRYDGYAFKVFKSDPDDPTSISDGWITSITEDRNGYLWIGTRRGGLNRYDPVSRQFTHYQYERNNSTTLNDNHITSLLVDKDNQLWVGTLSGLNRFDARTNAFQRYPSVVISQPSVDEEYPPSPAPEPAESGATAEPAIITQGERLSGKSVSAVFQDSVGRLWIGTTDGGLNGFNPASGSFTYYHPIAEDTASISDYQVTSISEDSNGDLWIGTNNGLNQFDPRLGTFNRFMHDQEDPRTIASDSINVVKTDNSGNLWIGTSNGLDRLEKDKSRFIHYQRNPLFQRSLSNNYILSIFEDRGGVLWFGTYGGGVNRYDRALDKFTYYRHDPTDPQSLSGNLISPIHVDRKGFAWVGADGQGLNRFLWRTGEVTRYENDPANPASLASNVITAILEDSDNTLWVGAINGLDKFNPIHNTSTHYRFDPSNPQSISANMILSIFEDSQKQLWIGTSVGLDLLDKATGAFTHFRPNLDDPTALSGNRALAIHEDTQGYLWIGTAENGLNRMDPQTKSFIHYRHNPLDRKSLSSDSILSIYQDSTGRLWIGTAGSGLNLYLPESKSFKHYTEKDGLPNGFIYGILEDAEGRLWMSTNFGISRFDPDTETFRNFDAGDGLQSNEFKSSAYAKGIDGEFYFGGINGLTVFDPLNITDNDYLAPVALTSLNQEDEVIETDTSVETLQSLTLTWPQNSFEFEFTALSYNQPGKNLYAYTLEGFDINWHYIGAKRNGRYTNLPGGNYTLLLKAANSDGVWNETPTRVTVTVVPPFWQTLWFRFLLGCLAALAVAGGVRLRTKTIQDRNRQLERLVRERTNALEIRNQEIQALYQADERILRNVSLQQVFQTLVDVAVDALNADRSVVFAWDEKQTKVVPRVSRGFSRETLKLLEFTKGEGVIGKVLESGEPAVVRQIELNELRADIREAIIAEGIRSFVHLPIVVDSKIVGVFNVGFTKPNLIGDDTTRLFSALTQRASLSIANMELFEQTKDLAVMEERNRLARDLHDSAKQKAFAALAQLGAARGILSENSDSVSLRLIEAENLVSDVIQELTFLVQEIYPITLQEKGLGPALRDYIYEWENRTDTTVQLIHRNDRRLPLEMEQALYRVTQEALANVARHSRARRVDIFLVYNNDSVQLSLADDGCGFDANVKSYGMGLRSIRERVSSIHGTLQIQSAPGHGTRILIQAPIKN